MAPATKKASSRGVKKEDQKAAANGGFAKLFAVKSSEKETPAAGAEQPEKAKAANPLQKLFGAQAKAPAAEAKPETAKPNQVQQAVIQAPSPARSTAPPPVADTASEPAAGKPALTQEQLARIEENKRKAREKQQAKRAREEPPSSKVEETPSPQRTVSRPAAVNSPGQNVVTPEKVSHERRAAATPQQAATTEVIPASAGRFAAAALECKNWMQYHDLYALRVKQLKRRAQEEAQNLWGGVLSPESFLTEITGYKRKGESAEVVLVGILFKELKGRANVIEQYKDIKVGSAGHGAEAEAAQRLNTEADTLWLEDGSMRLQLQMQPEQVANLPTGVVVGVRGTAMADGKFSVKAHCFPRMASPPALPTAPVQGRFLALVSGLAFGKEEGAEGLTSARARAMDFLLKGGERGEVVERLLVCGGTFSQGSDLETGSISKAALQDADDYFAGLAASVPINLMPGRGDPANLCLPQLPLHSFLFKRVRGCQNFKSVTNPYECTSEGLTVLGHSGQPVDDLLRCTTISSPLAALELCVRASHLAPTAPDTLPTQPFSTGDPFLLSELPHILFSGGHAKAEYRWHPSEEGTGGTLCACVPAFYRQPAVLLVNLSDPRDLRVHEFGEAAQADEGEKQDAVMGQEQEAPEQHGEGEQPDAVMGQVQVEPEQPDMQMETSEAVPEAGDEA